MRTGMFWTGTALVGLHFGTIWYFPGIPAKICSIFQRRESCCNLRSLHVYKCAPECWRTEDSYPETKKPSYNLINVIGKFSAAAISFRYFSQNRWEVKCLRTMKFEWKIWKQNYAGGSTSGLISLADLDLQIIVAFNRCSIESKRLH